MVVRLGDENSIAMVDGGEVTTCRSWSHRSRQRCTLTESRNLENVEIYVQILDGVHSGAGVGKLEVIEQTW